MWVGATAVVRPETPDFWHTVHHLCSGDELPPQVPCRCVGHEAWEHARGVATQRYGPLEALEHRYREERSRLDVDARLRFPTWEEFVSPAEDAYQEAARKHPSWGVADPNCSLCRGSGEVEAPESGTYVPCERAELYWESVKPESAEMDHWVDGIYPCRFCDRTGKRADRHGATCDWCGGTGRICTRLGDSRPDPAVSCPDLLALFPAGFVTGRLVAPDARVYSYWYLYHDGDADELRQCAEEVQTLLSRHQDCLAVVMCSYAS